MTIGPSARATVRERLRTMLPRAVLRRLRPGSTPTVGRVDFGDLRRTRPISGDFGFDRGLPIDRYYIERFLAARADDIRGRVLEVGDASYTRRFGGSRVTRSDVLHVHEGAPEATIVGDLASADHVPSDAFDAIVLTQTLHLIYDVRAAIATLHRILAPGGVLLATVPGISPIDRTEWKDTWFWALTEQSARRLFEERFAESVVDVKGHGNVLAAVAFIEGIASEELSQPELDVVDASYPVCIAIRAVKPDGA